MGWLPIWWERGHHVSKPSVKTENARSRLAFTEIDLRTGACTSVTIVIGPPE
jgi:hypothetical protein